MASAATILSQGVPALLNAFPGWKTPVHFHLRASVTGGSGAIGSIASANSASGQAGTTPGVSIVRTSGVAGTYDVTFPPCKSIAEGSIVVNVIPPVVTVGADRRVPAIDFATANTNSTTGKLRFNLVPPNSATVTDPVALSEIHVSFWADLG